MSARKAKKSTARPSPKKPRPPRRSSPATPRTPSEPRLSREGAIDCLVAIATKGSTEAMDFLTSRLHAQGFEDIQGLLRDALVRAAAPTTAAAPCPPPPHAQHPQPPIHVGLPPLTDRQHELVRFIYDRMTATGMYPRHSEIAERFEIPQRQVARYLRPLARLGYLRHGKRGDWRLTDDAIRAFSS